MTEDHRQALAAILEELRTSPIPIDMPQIRRALIALLETILEAPESPAH